MAIYLFLALPIIFIFLLTHRQKSPIAKLHHPPGPPGLPFVGNILQYDSSNLHLSLAKLSNKYGPLMYMKIIGKPVIVISSARVAKEALKHNDLAFSSRPSTTCAVKLSYNNRDIANSPYSEYWREMRKLIVLRLFTLKQVSSFRPIREEEVLRAVKEISEQAKSGQLVNISQVALSLSSSIICRVALGKRYDEKGSEKRSFDKLLEQIQALSVQIFVADCVPSLGWIDIFSGKVSQLEKVFKDMDSFYEEVIDEHLSLNRPQTMNGDILDLLIRLREDPSSSVEIDWDHIKGILMNIFVAGTDTTAAAITWAMTALIKSPNVLKKVKEEIRSLIGKKGRVDEDDINKLPYLKAVVKEILRLYPPVPLSLPRLTTKTCFIDGYEIEPDSIVFVNVWAIGRDPDYWENPNEFLPERFLNCSINLKGQDFGFLTFGSGRRQCPGMSLGIKEVEVALANLLYMFDWELPHGMSEEDIDTDSLPGISMHKKNALCLVAKSYLTDWN